jgi:hypothetical protein
VAYSPSGDKRSVSDLQGAAAAAQLDLLFPDHDEDDEDAYLENARLPGFIAAEDIMQIIAQLGRDGLTYEGYQKFMEEFQLGFSHSEVYDSFFLTDVNQDGSLTFNKFMAGFYILVKMRFPERVIGKLGLSETDIVRYVLGTVVLFGGVFTFLFLATLALSGGGSFDIFAQAGGTVGAAMFLRNERAVESGGVYRDLMLEEIGHALGIPHAIVQKIKKRMDKGEVDS